MGVIAIDRNVLHVDFSRRRMPPGASCRTYDIVTMLPRIFDQISFSTQFQYLPIDQEDGSVTIDIYTEYDKTKYVFAKVMISERLRDQELISGSGGYLSDASDLMVEMFGRGKKHPHVMSAFFSYMSIAATISYQFNTPCPEGIVLRKGSSFGGAIHKFMTKCGDLGILMAFNKNSIERYVECYYGGVSFA